MLAGSAVGNVMAVTAEGIGGVDLSLHRQQRGVMHPEGLQHQYPDT